MPKLLLKNVRFSYANVFTPKEDDKGKEKYSVSLLIPKSDKEQLKQLNAALDEIKKEALAKFYPKKSALPDGFKLPLRDGDNEREEDEAYRGMYFMNANSIKKPDVLDRAKQLITPESGRFYSGCWGAVTVTFFTFDNEGKKGIACGLGNIMMLKDGEKLAGGSTGEEDFKDFEIPEDDEESML